MPTKLRIALVVAGALVAVALAANSIAAPSPTISIASGVEPRLTPTEAIAIAQNDIALMARSVGAAESSTVLKATAARGADVDSVEPGAGTAEGEQAESVYWVVRARGTFVGARGPAGSSDRVAATGYIVIDDATGDVVGMGLP
jgi:hypothetical protein